MAGWTDWVPSSLCSLGDWRDQLNALLSDGETAKFSGLDACSESLCILLGSHVKQRAEPDMTTGREGRRSLRSGQLIRPSGCSLSCSKDQS